jgi:hypothetical protein
MDAQAYNYECFARDLTSLTSSFRRAEFVEQVYDTFSQTFVKLTLIEDKKKYLSAAALAGNVDSRVVAACLRDDFDPGALEAIATASSGGWLHAWLTNCLCMLDPKDLCKVLLRLHQVGYVTLLALLLFRRMVKHSKRRAVSLLKSLAVRQTIEHNEMVLGRRPLRRNLALEYVPQ